MTHPIIGVIITWFYAASYNSNIYVSSLLLNFISFLCELTTEFSQTGKKNQL